MTLPDSGNTPPLSNKKKSKRTRRFYNPDTYTRPSEPLHIKTVVNLSSHILTVIEKEVLSKNLTFCPTPQRIDYLELSADIHRFSRRLRLAEFFYEDDQQNNNRNTDNDNDIDIDNSPNNSNNSDTNNHSRVFLRNCLHKRSRDNALDMYIKVINIELMTFTPKKTFPNLRNEEKNLGTIKMLPSNQLTRVGQSWF